MSVKIYAVNEWDCNTWFYTRKEDAMKRIKHEVNNYNDNCSSSELKMTKTYDNGDTVCYSTENNHYGFTIYVIEPSEKFEDED